MKIYPNNDVITQWESIFVPKNDVFFISKNFLELYSDIFKTTLIFERKHFFQHSEYNTLVYNNFHGYWNISKEIDYCIVAMPGWYERLSKDVQQRLLKEQKKSDSYSVINKEYILTNEKWNRMSSEEKHSFFNSVIDQLKDNVVTENNESFTNNITDIANTFSPVHGSNCFGTVLYMITNNDWYLSEWVYAENLMFEMNQRNFKEIATLPMHGDVVIWYQDNQPFHAAVCIGDNLFLNKNNQMIWSPFKIVALEQIINDFTEMSYKVFRE